MAITKGAKKAHRQSLRRKTLNDARRANLRAALKLSRTGTDPKATLAAAYKAIDKAVKRGLLSKNTAARRKSKVSRSLKAK
jgi:small subunit ribosomal protein S20